MKHERPNVVIVLSDDQGWGDLSVNGNTDLDTPHIDSLARDGALFDRFYVCAVCSPTRAELLTGRYHTRSGVYSTSEGGERFNLDEQTVAQTFKAADYATGAFGKWHSGMQWPYHPNARGFDEFYGFCSGHWGHYFDPVLEHNGELTRGKGFIIDDLTDHAMQFMEDNRDRPFFCYVPYNTPHSPMQVPDRFFDKFNNLTPQARADGRASAVTHTRAALAMCEDIDWNVGRILEKIDALDLADNTIVLYFSDNGPNGWRWNGGMKGRKGSTDEGGVRSPLVIRWPGKIRPGTTIPEIAGAIDLLPTLADLAGIPVEARKPLDGVSLKPLLLGGGGSWPERVLFNPWRGKVSARTQRFRLDHRGRLYDMLADPGQNHDVSNRHPDVRRRLEEAVERWRKDSGLETTDRDRPFPVGYREFPVTHLPARDGVAHGGVRRSNKAPNCSYFRDWSSPEDRITWDIEVATSGNYEATLYYACAAKDVGSTVELRFGEAAIEAGIGEAHDPPAVGAAHDRHPRVESYVKDFKPMKLGVLALEKGRGPLTLRALNVAGERVAEVRYIVLRLL